MNPPSLGRSEGLGESAGAYLFSAPGNLTPMRCMIVIPARMGSTRFPGKPLCDLLGRPMVQWVYEAAIASKVAERVIVATPDEEIVQACKSFGAEAMLTSHD